MLYFYSKACGSPGFATEESSIDKFDDKNTDTNHFYCNYCQIYVPLRASHCRICKKCILRRDHHCQYTNNCIGRDNHFYFFMFTTLAFISDIVPQLDATIHLIIRYTKIVKNKFFIITVLCYTFFIIATTFACFLTYNLSYQCILTIISNATIWERKKKDRITYLKNCPNGKSPFDKGLFGNIIEFCTMKQKKMKWKIRNIDINC